MSVLLNCCVSEQLHDQLHDVSIFLADLPDLSSVEPEISQSWGYKGFNVSWEVPAYHETVRMYYSYIVHYHQSETTNDIRESDRLIHSDISGNVAKLLINGDDLQPETSYVIWVIPYRGDPQWEEGAQSRTVEIVTLSCKNFVLFIVGGGR